MRIFQQLRDFLTKSYRTSELLPPYQLGKPVQKEWNLQNAIDNGYKASTWVFSCVNAISKAAAAVPWRVYEVKADGTRTLLPQHPLELLILKPNPYSSRKDLIERMTHHLYLGGDSYNTKVRDSRGIVAELWPLHPDFVRVVPSKENFISHYEYRNQGVVTNIEPGDLIHNMFIDPSNPYNGLAPIRAAAQTIDADIAAVKWNRSSLENRAVTDGVFTFEQPLTRDQWERARQEVREQHQGANNARTPWILSGGARYEAMSMSPAEMDFINSRRFTREEICAIFQVPPAIVGILDNSSYNNITTARRIFWEDTIKPYLEDLKNCFNSSLAFEFGPNIELCYDLSPIEAVQENLGEKIKNASSLFSMGVPFNKINERLGLGFDEVEGGEVGYLPASLMPAAGPAAPQPAPQPGSQDDNDDESQDKGSHQPRQVKALNLQSDEQKDLYWKQFDRSRASWITAFYGRAQKRFLDEGEAVANAYAKGGTAAAEDEIKAQAAKWERLFVAEWSAITKHYAEQTYNNIKSAAGPQETKLFRWFWDLLEDKIQNYILQNTGQKITGVTDTTKNGVMQIIYDMRTAAEKPATVDEVRRAIKKEYEEFSVYRAWRIARTEVVAASNYGSYATANELDEVKEKEWITSLDSRVREQHQPLHKQRVPINEKFSNGLNYPAEYTAGKKKQTINCRCALVYHTED